MQKWLALFSLITLLNCTSSVKNQTINIAVAANFQFAIEEIVERFEQESGIQCNIIMSSSGKLTAQISEGAPYDLFISADLKYPEYLHQKNLTFHEPIIYAEGKLVLWSANKNSSISIEDLTNPKITHIAIANPETAPYGKAAKEILNNLGIWEEVYSKLVFGESIAQTNQFITTEAANVGFTSKSIVLSSQINGLGSWSEINDTLYNPIIQAYVSLKTGKASKANIDSLANFLHSESVNLILTKYGYVIHDL